MSVKPISRSEVNSSNSDDLDVESEQESSAQSDINSGLDSGSDSDSDSGSGSGGFIKPDSLLNKFTIWSTNFLSGDILSKSEVKRYYPYAVFLVVLAFLYITHIFSVQQLYREHSKLTSEIKDLRAKSLTITSYKMQATRHSNIIKMLDERGSELQESLTPNVVIEK